MRELETWREKVRERERKNVKEIERVREKVLR